MKQKWIKKKQKMINLKELGKFYNYIKSKITLLLLIAITMLINIYIPDFWFNINLKYSLYLIVLLIIFILFFMLEVIIYISYIKFKGKIEESKNLKYIPKYYLNNINNFRKNKHPDKDLLISYLKKIIYYYICIIVKLVLVGIFVYLI
uniref:Uncharacterized protein n=1 Tax=Cyclocybe aegerita TaxID=1973307 RepID=A0A884P6K2_CYCAE|nr:hypothetical protein K4014_mgp17 [Cyclocybe aegerita]QQP21459.1 hypothetical protein [Cyclocybe aegerita]